MATKSKPKAVPFSSWTGLPYVTGSKPTHPQWASLPTPAHLKPKPKKKTVIKNVVSVEPNQHHRDMMGKQINQGDFVLAVQNNRPFPFKVLKLNETTLTIVPAIKKKDITHRAMGGSIPAYKNYRREGWNVYLIPKEEIFMYNLTGNVTI
jgi:hypothetical protein